LAGRSAGGCLATLADALVEDERWARNNVQQYSFQQDMECTNSLRAVLLLRLLLELQRLAGKAATLCMRWAPPFTNTRLYSARWPTANTLEDGLSGSGQGLHHELTAETTLHMMLVLSLGYAADIKQLLSKAHQAFFVVFAPLRAVNVSGVKC
jgi:hypothetical protein